MTRAQDYDDTRLSLEWERDQLPKMAWRFDTLDEAIAFADGAARVINLGGDDPDDPDREDVSVESSENVVQLIARAS
jgi:hypothetical protein